MTGPAYQNPVYPRSFPDPFVLKFQGEYWGYCTGLWHDGRVFGVIHSRDLVAWQDRAGAMAPLAADPPHYWAPEVSYLDGRFYLYYSAGDEERMEIRVAVAEHPAGPFADSGRRLTSEVFAIDAHVFTARDGARWLFYATDFLTGSHVGTGTVRDRLLDPFTLAGDPRPVTLPRYDWHVYHPNRPEKGGVRWHTVEGPFVLERKGLLYEMFSGGNWQNPTYGVSYATARSVETPGEWQQAADGERVLPILRSGGEVVGPGHNSVVRGPDDRQLYCVYHRWSPDAKARVMAIDPLDWAGERLLVLGPTTTPQPAPNPPTISGPVAPIILAAGEEVRYEAGASTFLVEVSARTLGEPGGLGVVLFGAEGNLLHTSYRLEPSVRLIRFEANVDGPATGVALVAEGAAVEFSGFALTVGWEDRFEQDAEPAALGWEVLDGGDWRIEEGELVGFSEMTSTVSWIARGPALESYELVVNARLIDGSPEDGFGIAPALDSAGTGPRLLLARQAPGGWALLAGEQIFHLSTAFDPFIYQQFRFRRAGTKVEIAWEGLPLGAVEVPPGPARIGLGARGAAWFDAVRVTAIPG
ncbi:MAG TPA: glycoside hydrolase family 43 protein [Thermoanaerobaculia bacterium]|jgi:GH43 family beta-xylosidase|nr:glycoside hydrolase family 43 protein [Thermoanaerobaculia bacterium]